MIGLDTNVLVRLLVQDDDAQFKSANTLMRNHKVYLSDTVLLETGWVLRFGYDHKPDEICAAFRRLLGLKNVVVSDPDKIAKVLDWHESGVDFADAFHLANCEHLASFKTFDEKFIKRARGLSECKVSAA